MKLVTSFANRNNLDEAILMKNIKNVKVCKKSGGDTQFGQFLTVILPKPRSCSEKCPWTAWRMAQNWCRSGVLPHNWRRIGAASTFQRQFQRQCCANYGVKRHLCATFALYACSTLVLRQLFFTGRECAAKHPSKRDPRSPAYVPST